MIVTGILIYSSYIWTHLGFVTSKLYQSPRTKIDRATLRPKFSRSHEL